MFCWHVYSNIVSWNYLTPKPLRCGLCNWLFLWTQMQDLLSLKPGWAASFPPSSPGTFDSVWRDLVVTAGEWLGGGGVLASDWRRPRLLVPVLHHLETSSSSEEQSDRQVGNLCCTRRWWCRRQAACISQRPLGNAAWLSTFLPKETQVTVLSVHVSCVTAWIPVRKGINFSLAGLVW